MSERQHSSPAFCAQLPSRFACRPRETWRYPWTAPQRGLVAPSLQRALRALIAGYIGARIGKGTTVTLVTDTAHTSRRTDMVTRLPTAIAITNNPTTGLGTHTGRSEERRVGK